MKTPHSDQCSTVAKTMSSNKRREIIQVETLQEIQDNNPETQTQQQNEVERSDLANGRCLYQRALKDIITSYIISYIEFR